MEELNQALDGDEFVDALGRLYESVSKPEKDMMLLKPNQRDRSISNKRKHDPNFDFKVS